MRKLLFFILACSAFGVFSCSREKKPDDAAARAAKEYYDSLFAKNYAYFVRGMYLPDTIPDGYREQLEANASMFVGRMAEEHRGVSRVTPGRMPWMKSRVLRPLFNRLLVTDRYFHTLPSCNGCHTCSAHCPVRNIRHRPDGRPEWLGHCTGCLACYHTCPQHAVRFGHTTRHKGQYTCPTDGQPRRSGRKNETADRNTRTADRKSSQCARHLPDHTQSIIHKP